MTDKPEMITNSTYDINQLSTDRRFEELMNRVFQYRVKDDKKGEFDTAFLMPGIMEKGVNIKPYFDRLFTIL